MAEAIRLQYEARSSQFGTRCKRIAALALSLSIAIGVYAYRGKLQASWATSKYLWRQHKWLTHTFDPGRVVYAEDARLESEPEYEKIHCDSGMSYTIWRATTDDPPRHTQSTRRDALLFSHERQTETGQRLLLVVRAFITSGYPDHRDHLMFSMEEFHIATRERPWLWTRNGLRTVIPELDLPGRASSLRLFGGQADPNDPTHFTIRYQLGDKEGVLDGYEAEQKQGEQFRRAPGFRLELRKPPTTEIVKH